MKDFIKKYSIILIVAGIGLLFIGIDVIGNLTDRHQSAQVEQIVTNNNRQLLIDSMRQVASVELIKQKDELIKQSETKIQTQKLISERLAKAVKIWKTKTDSLLAAYHSDPTIDRCDSVVEAQGNVIKEQDSVIESIGQEAEEYSRQVHLLKQKVVLLDSTVIQQKRTVQSLSLNLDNTRILYEKLSERRKIGNAIRNTLILLETVYIIIKVN